MTNLESPPHPPLDQKSDAELNAVGCGIDDDDVGGIPSGPWDAERSEHSLEDGERCVRALPGTGGTADEDTNHQVTQPKEGLSSFAASLIVVNYMSAAYLLLPGSFAQGGIVLSIVVLVFVSFQSSMTSNFVLEACARAEYLEGDPVAESTSVSSSSSSSSLSSSFRRRESQSSSSDNHVDSHHEVARRSFVQIKSRKFELSLLQEMFLGRRWNYFFTLSTALDLYGITWAFCSIFASALAERCPIAGVRSDYQFYVGIFVIIALPLSLTSILDQMWVQMAFLGARLLMVLLMIVTLLVAFANPDTSYFGDQVGPLDDVPLINWSGTMQVIQTAFFATAFQFSVPAVSHVTREKKVLRNIFHRAVLFVFVSSLVLSVLVSLYFGTNATSSTNLNWVQYTASPVVSYYIVLFAAIDGVAVYPLIAVSLGGILMGLVYGDQVHEAETNWKIRSAFRLFASVPQAIGALFIDDLGVIALYTGIFTILSYTVCPALLCLQSHKRMIAGGLSTKTYYSSSPFGSHLIWAYALLVMSVLVIVGVVLDSTLSQYRSS